ncbi:MAG: TATA-box-binding protein [Promethearchaeota archaeon]
MSKENLDDKLIIRDFGGNHRGEVSYKVVNIVATVITEIEGVIDLNQIIQRISNVEYHPDRFPGLIMRIENPHATLLIFTSGRMVITGLKKNTDANLAAQQAVEKMQNIGFKIKNPKVTIQNIVATSSLNITVDLNMLTIIMDNVMYEPEVFPAAIYKMQDPKTVFLIFSTGKIVCLGAKVIETIDEAISILIKQLSESEVTDLF